VRILRPLPKRRAWLTKRVSCPRRGSCLLSTHAFAGNSRSDDLITRWRNVCFAGKHCEQCLRGSHHLNLLHLGSLCRLAGARPYCCVDMQSMKALHDCPANPDKTHCDHSALQMLTQSANLSLEFWSSDAGLDYCGRYSCVFSGCSRPVPVGLLTRSQRNACRTVRPLESPSE
jgi:hypothetical protein